MGILESIVLGIVQGLTEFLPVSSSGHLVLLQKIFEKLGSPINTALFFDTMLHLGTLIAVVVVMWKEIIDLFRKPFHNLLYLVIATIPAVIFALLFKKFIDSTFGGYYLGYAFLLTAVILTLSELIANSVTRKKELKSGAALTMGIMQCVGIFPGVSRSGSTIAGGLAYGVDREKAAKFSFLMSIPAIIGANILQGYEAIKSAVDIQWLPVIIGTVCAAVAGYAAVKFMLALIQRKKLYGFAIYVAVLGAFVLLDRYIFHIINW
jgi:undecaprenyl-diphosphatase